MYPAPVIYKLAPGESGCESKMMFHQRNKKDVAVRTRRPLRGAEMLSQVSGQVAEAGDLTDRRTSVEAGDPIIFCSVRSALPRLALRGGSSAATPSSR